MKKILIIDDDPDIVELIKNRLQQHGYEIVSCNDGDSGVKKAVASLPDLIIMDVMMPNLSGGEAVKLLKSNTITQHIPIIFFTALATSLADDTGLAQINVDGKLYLALSKPFDPNKLLAAIKSLLGN